MHGVNFKLVEAAKSIRVLDAAPPTSMDGVFLTELIAAIDVGGKEQMMLPPLVIYQDTTFVVSQGPTLAAMGEIAFFHRETQLSEQVGMIRDLVCQMSVSSNTAWRIEDGLGNGNTGVHDGRITAGVKIEAMVALLDAVGYASYMMPFEADVGAEDVMVPLPAPGWRVPMPFGATVH